MGHNLPNRPFRSADSHFGPWTASPAPSGACERPWRPHGPAGHLCRSLGIEPKRLEVEPPNVGFKGKGKQRNLFGSLKRISTPENSSFFIQRERQRLAKTFWRLSGCIALGCSPTVYVGDNGCLSTRPCRSKSNLLTKWGLERCFACTVQSRRIFVSPAWFLHGTYEGATDPVTARRIAQRLLLGQHAHQGRANN